jgi:hypothetical protein
MKACFSVCVVFADDRSDDGRCRLAGADEPAIAAHNRRCAFQAMSRIGWIPQHVMAAG